MDRFQVRKGTRHNDARRPAPRVEGLEHRLLFAAVVRSAIGDRDAVDKVVRQFQDDMHEGPWTVNSPSGGVPLASLGGSREIVGWESLDEFGSVSPPPD